MVWAKGQKQGNEKLGDGGNSILRIEFRQVTGQWETRLERRVRTFCGGPRLTVCFYHKCNESCQGSWAGTECITEVKVLEKLIWQIQWRGKGWKKVVSLVSSVPVLKWCELREGMVNDGTTEEGKNRGKEASIELDNKFWLFLRVRFSQTLSGPLMQVSGGGGGHPFLQKAATLVPRVIAITDQYCLCKGEDVTGRNV